MMRCEGLNHIFIFGGTPGLMPGDYPCMCGATTWDGLVHQAALAEKDRQIAELEAELFRVETRAPTFAEMDNALVEKDTKISLLRDEIHRLEIHTPAVAELDDALQKQTAITMNAIRQRNEAVEKNIKYGIELAEKARQISLLIANMDADSKEIGVLHGQIDEKAAEITDAWCLAFNLWPGAKEPFEGGLNEAILELDRRHRAEIERLGKLASGQDTRMGDDFGDDPISVVGACKKEIKELKAEAERLNDELSQPCLCCQDPHTGRRTDCQAGCACRSPE